MEKVEIKKICVNCNDRPVLIKKRGLCAVCYQRLRNKLLKTPEGKEPTTPLTKAEHAHKRELDFIKNYFTHNDWIYHPAIFCLGEFKYTPDFYDGERKVFIEMAGTRQAYDVNKEKYALMKEKFPAIPFEVRKVNGELLEIDSNGRAIWMDAL